MISASRSVKNSPSQPSQISTATSQRDLLEGKSFPFQWIRTLMLETQTTIQTTKAQENINSICSSLKCYIRQSIDVMMHNYNHLIE